MVIFKSLIWDQTNGGSQLISSKGGDPSKYSKAQAAYTTQGGDQTLKLLKWIQTLMKCTTKH